MLDPRAYALELHEGSACRVIRSVAKAIAGRRVFWLVTPGPNNPRDQIRVDRDLVVVDKGRRPLVPYHAVPIDTEILDPAHS